MSRNMTLLLWLGVVVGGVGIMMRISGSVFFIILWMIGIGALNQYFRRRGR